MGLRTTANASAGKVGNTDCHQARVSPSSRSATAASAAVRNAASVSRARMWKIVAWSSGWPARQAASFTAARTVSAAVRMVSARGAVASSQASAEA